MATGLGWELTTPAGRADAVAAIYLGYFGRAPDPAGLAFWTDQLDRGMAAGRDGIAVLRGIADSFAAVPEAANAYELFRAPESATRADYENFVARVYQNLFDRAPGSDGRDYWVEQLRGATNPGRAVLDIISGAQGADGAAVAHKVDAGRYYAEQVAATGAAFAQTDARETVARAGVTADSLAGARAFVDQALAHTPGGGAPDPRPDLVADAVVRPGEGTALTPGGEAELAVTARNRGDAAAEQRHTLTYFLSEDAALDSDDTRLGEDRVGPLAPMATADRQFTFELPETIGTRRQFVIVDSDTADAVAESDETNNRQPAAFTPSSVPQPELIARAFVAEAARGPVGAGREVTLEVGMTNRGDADARREAELRVFLSDDRRVDRVDDTELDDFRVDALDAGETARERVALDLPDELIPDRYFLVVELDPAGAVNESNGTNNTTAAPVDVVAAGATKPDLIASALIPTDPADIAAGNAIAVDVTARNAGNAEAASFDAAFYLSADRRLDAGDRRLDDEGVGALDPGETDDADVDLELPDDLAVQGRFVLVHLDDDDEVRERAEGNNVLALDLATAGRGRSADLRPRLARADEPDDDRAVDDTFVPGEGVPVTGTLANRGDAAAAAASTTRFYLSEDRNIDPGADFRLGERAQAPLFAGESVPLDGDVFLPETVAAGTYFLIARADAGDAVVESDETNNTADLRLTIETDGLSII